MFWLINAMLIVNPLEGLIKIFLPGFQIQGENGRADVVNKSWRIGRFVYPYSPRSLGVKKEKSPFHLILLG